MQGPKRWLKIAEALAGRVQLRCRFDIAAFVEQDTWKGRKQLSRASVFKRSSIREFYYLFSSARDGNDPNRVPF